MIRGVVNTEREAIVRLRVRAPGGAEYAVDALVDTGFTGGLAVPPSVAVALGLTFESFGRMTLADGTTRRFDICTGQVWWGNS